MKSVTDTALVLGMQRSDYWRLKNSTHNEHTALPFGLCNTPSTIRSMSIMSSMTSSMGKWWDNLHAILIDSEDEKSHKVLFC